MTQPQTADSTDRDPLPATSSPTEFHTNSIAAGTHPSIEWGDSYRDVRFSDTGGFLITDTDDLIGFAEHGRCPVCGRTGSVAPRYTRADDEVTDPSFTFVRGVTNRKNIDGDGLENNSAIERLEAHGYYPVVCRAGTKAYYIGLAARAAVEGYHEWKRTQDDREQFRSLASALAHDPHLDEAFGAGYSKGVLVAAIYEQLDAVSYDETALMDRGNVTKGHLLTILSRLQSLDTTPRSGWSPDEWGYRQEFGITNGRVEWHVPEWALTDGLNWSEHFRTRLYGDKSLPDGAEQYDDGGPP